MFTPRTVGLGDSTQDPKSWNEMESQMYSNYMSGMVEAIKKNVDSGKSEFIIDSNQLLNNITTAYDFMLVSSEQNQSECYGIYEDLDAQYHSLLYNTDQRGEKNALANRLKMQSIRASLVDYKRVCDAMFSE